MTPRQREAAQAASTYHVAMMLIGGQAYASVLDLWADVVPTESRVSNSGAAWLESALKVVRLHRHQVEAIAVPYLRLVRALHTGYTWQNILTGDTLTAVPLSVLRQDFVDAVERYAPGAFEDGLIPDPDPTDDIPAQEVRESDGSEYRPYRLEDWLDDGTITIEQFDWIQDELDAVEDELELEAQKILSDLGPELLKRRLTRLSVDDKLQTPREVESEREDEQRKIGRGVAAHAERIVENGGRRAEYRTGSRDERVLGFVRVHEPKGHPPDAVPCGFCALLLTRGFVPQGKGRSPAYSSWKSAGGAQDEQGNNPDEYHAGDHCRAEQVFSLSQIDDDPRFNLNRQYADLYADRISGRYGGKSALTEWRRLIRNLKAGQESA